MAALSGGAMSADPDHRSVNPRFNRVRARRAIVPLAAPADPDPERREREDTIHRLAHLHQDRTGCTFETAIRFVRAVAIFPERGRAVGRDETLARFG